MPIIADKNLLSKCLFILGDGYKFQSDFKHALECHLESLKIQESEVDLKEISESLHDLGWTYAEINSDKAILYHTRNIEFRKKLNDLQGLAETLIAIGVCYQAKKDHEKALDFYLQALAIFQKPDFITITHSRDFWIGTVKNDIGWNYNEWGKPDKALPYLKSSLELKEKDGNPQALTYVVHSLGET